jgi:hypothetical protein
MVKIKVTLPDPPEADGSLKGSSPVRGNAYAGFLLGWGLATVPGYPTQPDRHQLRSARQGGLYNSGWADMASSILAENTDGWSAGDPLHAPDCYSPNPYDFTSYRHNVVGVLNGNCDFGDYTRESTAWIDHGTEWSPFDAELAAPLFWGNIRYRMISSSSPVVDAAASAPSSGSRQEE